MFFGAGLVVVLLCAFIGTWILKKYAISRQILDIPQARSCHSQPTPRGGGLSFVVVFMLAILSVNHTSSHVNIYSPILLLTLAAMAILGFIDDRKSLSALFRVVLQFILAALVVWQLSPLPNLDLAFFTISSGYFLCFLVVLYLVWLTNLYNFMDGINGIACIEAISVSLGLVLVFYLSGNSSLIVSPVLLAAAVAGFLPWNFPKAHIFMGDIGSSFLGFAFGILSLQALLLDQQLFWSCLVLLGVFIVDTTLTLAIRFCGGEKISQAHCSHAFQHASKLYNSHVRITTSVFLINILWLLPIACLISLHIINGLFGLFLSYLPLVLLALRFNSGKS